MGATPAEAVRPVVSRMRSLIRRATSTPSGEAPGVLGHVEIRLVERQRLDQRRDLAEDREHLVGDLAYFRKFGGTMTSSGQRRTARDMDIADRTPNVRAS